MFTPLISFTGSESCPSCTETDRTISGTYLNGLLGTRELRNRLFLDAEVLAKEGNKKVTKDGEDPLGKFAPHLNHVG